ncbi:MAG: hypothetical protein M3512_15255 [Bacteroidota bacterium]|nr:hypothetical protein [Bacteroidota bacterium]
MIKYLLSIFIIFFCIPHLVLSQVDHRHHQEHEEPDSTTVKASEHHEQSSHQDIGHDMESVPSVLSLNLPMTVNASGTAWHPINSPMYMNFFSKGNWNIMLHYGAFPAYTFQNPANPGFRSANEVFLPTWAMAMASTKMGRKGLLTFRGMVSADPFIMGGAGYPLLYQTGETHLNEPLIDRQHPHDLFSELSITYSHAITDDVDAYIYLGYPGEPAIGPPAFMHRLSGLNIPDSPLGHHWQDATHIIYGVATTGFRFKRLRVEGSWFTGREPGENRLWFDKPRFDSWSGRINYLLGNSFALQASYSYLHSPEVHEPERDVNRITMSALHNVWFDDENVLSSSLVWGLNRSWDRKAPGMIFPSNSLLFETALQMRRINIFARTEILEKSFHELGIEYQHDENGHDEDDNVWIGTIKPGASIYLYKHNNFWLDAGFTISYHRTSHDLEAYYGSQNTMSYQVFIRMVPPRMAKH